MTTSRIAGCSAMAGVCESGGAVITASPLQAAITATAATVMERGVRTVRSCCESSRRRADLGGLEVASEERRQSEAGRYLPAAARHEFTYEALVGGPQEARALRRRWVAPSPHSLWSSPPSRLSSSNARNEFSMLRLMTSALAAFVGSIAAPVASVNQLATSTAIVRFEVPASTVTGGWNIASISASTSDVNVNAWATLFASVKVPITMTLTPWKSGCAVKNALAPASFFFASRRRHTRLTCDWSSDVCSSD